MSTFTQMRYVQMDNPCLFDLGLSLFHWTWPSLSWYNGSITRFKYIYIWYTRCLNIYIREILYGLTAHCSYWGSTRYTEIDRTYAGLMTNCTTCRLKSAIWSVYGICLYTQSNLCTGFFLSYPFSMRVSCIYYDQAKPVVDDNIVYLSRPTDRIMISLIFTWSYLISVNRIIHYRFFCFNPHKVRNVLLMIYSVELHRLSIRQNLQRAM